MSILNVDKIQPIGGGSTITVDATDIQASTGTIRASTFSGDVSATGIGVTSLNITGVTTSAGIVQAAQFKLLDNAKAKYGTGEDLEIYHNASNSLIQNGTGSLQVVTTTGDLFLRGQDNITFNTAGNNERLRIKSDGNVGINSTVPRGKLDIGFAGAPNFITFGSDADNPKVEFFRSTGGSPSHYATEIQMVLGDLVLSTAATANLGSHSYSEKLRIYSGGQVSIRNTNATSFNTGGDDLVIGNATDGQDAGITLYSHSSDNGSIFFNDTADTGLTGLIQYRHSEDAMRFITATQERLRITSDGKMGLNHNSPPSQFVVRAPGGSGHCSSQVHSGDSTTIMNMQTVQGSEGRFGMNTNHPLAIYTNGLERVRIPSTGGIELKTDGKGIQFPTTQTPTYSNSNRVGISSEMRYYETGTFVPGLSSTVLNSLQNAAFTDASYARRIGRYVRCGHLVFVNIEIKMASTVTYTAGVSDSTAPPCIVGVTPFYYAYARRFAVSGEPDYNPCSIFYSSSTLANDTLYAVLRREFPGSSYIQITKPGSNGSNQYNSTNFGEVFAPDATIAVSYTYAIDSNNNDY